MKIHDSKEKFILDTSAIVAYLTGESGAEKVKECQKKSHLPFIVLTELYYILFKKHGPLLADEMIHHVLSWHLPVLIPNEQICLSAGYLKGHYRLGIADSYIAAFALAVHATLLTKDADYKVLKSNISLIYLN